MPKLWDATIDAHRSAVREAVLDATAGLVAEHGVASVTMSQVAQASAIGRATLYKYFPDVGSILRAWHERQVGGHLHQLAQVRDRHPGRPGQALAAMLDVYAHICQAQHAAGPAAAALHQGEHMAHAHAHLHRLLADLIGEAARAGEVRTDVPAGELAGFCLAALQAASGVESKAGVGRLVAVTLAGLRPPDA